MCLSICTHFVYSHPGSCSLQNVLDVLHAVRYSAAHWKELGRRLVQLLDTETIEANHRRVEDCLEETVRTWLKESAGACSGAELWQRLADAVQLCRNGGGRNVAERIRQKTLRGG